MLCDCRSQPGAPLLGRHACCLALLAVQLGASPSPSHPQSCLPCTSACAVPYRPGGSMYARNPPFDPSVHIHLDFGREGGH